MTEELAAQGNERREGPGRVVGMVVLAALVAVSAVALTRERDGARGPRAGWTDYPVASESPSPVRIDDGPVFEEPPDPFADVTAITPPKAGQVTDVLLANGVPAFVVGSASELPTALAAFGGPDHAPVLVGWCAASRTFQDEAATYVYDGTGLGYGNAGHLRVHPVRGIGGAVEIAGASTNVTGPASAPRAKPAKCPAPLRYPRLPRRAGSVHDTVRLGFRVVDGRYAVTTESRSFCVPDTAPGCPTNGWEAYGLQNGVPGGDLAGSYAWEGDFLVRAERDGPLTAVRLPGTKLVERGRVGKAAVLGTVVQIVGEDPLALRIAVSERNNGNGMSRGRGHEEVSVRADAEIHLGPGHTGLGRPGGTTQVLRDYLDDEGVGAFLWFVLDARGQAFRVVVET